MRMRTRYFVIASLLVLGVGIGTGLVAYYVGFQASASQGPDELRLVPHDAVLVAYADVRGVMVSEVRQKLLQVLPSRGTGRQEFENQTGINIETDIDRVIACVSPLHADDQTLPLGPLGSMSGMVLARGRFNDVKIEALMREHGAHVEDYQGKRLVVADVTTANGSNSFSLAFLETGLVAVGNTVLIRRAADLTRGGDNVTSNDEIMSRVRLLDGNAWAVGRFDALTAQAKLPAGVATQLPPITWFSASGRVDGGINGVVRADTRDDEAATSLRDVVRGIVALARLQTGTRPELRPLVDSIQLGGTGNTVTMSFEISTQMFDFLTSAIQGLQQSRGRR